MAGPWSRTRPPSREIPAAADRSPYRLACGGGPHHVVASSPGAKVALRAPSSGGTAIEWGIVPAGASYSRPWRDHVSNATILIVDDEDLLRWSLAQRFSRDGWTVLEAPTAGTALERFASGNVDLVVLDVRLPDGDGLGVLRLVKEQAPETPVVLMTAFSTIENAVEAMKHGAYSYLRKPFDLDDMVGIAEKALETGRLRREVRALRSRTRGEFGFEAIIGRSPQVAAARGLLERIALSPATTVLITGETGTGKDLAAKAIHYNSERGTRPFVNITCSALPEPLLESELFGHERGAFTDARHQKRGLLETADGGTVFLDEVGEMTPGLQAKLLRFLEDRTFKRIGGLADIRVDVRVIAATNRDLAEAVRDGSFRLDLFYRLQVMPVRLPALRERGDDVLELTAHFIARYNGEFRKQVHGLTPAAEQILRRYRWPGNVRELRNAVERAMLLANESLLAPADFPSLHRDGAAWTVKLPPGGVKLEDVERQFLAQALQRANGNQTRAGQLLGINRDQVRYRLEKFRLTKTGEDLGAGD